MSISSTGKTPLELQFSKDQIIGTRDNQEDYVVCHGIKADDGSCRELICVLSDGMGGHEGGEIASRVAATAFIKLMKNKVGAEENAPTIMLQAAHGADNALSNRKSIEGGRLDQMGCTLCATWIKEGNLYYLGIGDSLIMLLRNKRLYLLNKLHNHREDMRRQAMREGVDWGQVSQSDSVIRYGARITSYLGGQGIAQADCPLQPLRLQRSDVILLASDGVLTLNWFEIAEILQKAVKGEPDKCVHNLLNQVKRKGAANQDNTSAIIISIQG